MQVEKEEGELARLEERIETTEAEAEIYRELAGAQRFDRQAEERQLKERVDEELASLKRKVESA